MTDSSSQSQDVIERETEESLISMGSSTASQLPYLINVVYWPYIKRVVKFHRIVQHMPCMREISHQIMKASQDAAADMFLNRLNDVEEPGKFQAFKEALGDSGYHIIVRALDDSKPISSKQDEHERLVRDVFVTRLLDTLDPQSVANALLEKDVISFDDAEIIHKEEERASKREANFCLLDALPRRSENWYETFLHILFSQGLVKLVEQIDPKLYTQWSGNSSQVDKSSPEISLDPSFKSRTVSSGSRESTPTLGNTLSGENAPPVVNRLSPGPPVQAPTETATSSLDRREGESSHNVLVEILRVVRTVEENQATLLQRLQRLENKVDSLISREQKH